jgi:hypothetical protein
MLSMVRWAIVATMLVGCGRFAFDAEHSPFSDASPIDAPPLGAFGAPMLLSPSLAGDNDEDCTMPDNELELYFASTRFGLPGEIYVVTRPDSATAWSAPVPVMELNSSVWEATPEISGDGNTMWLTSTRNVATGNEAFVSTRAARDQPWSTPQLVGELTVADSFVYGTAPIESQLAMVFASNRAGSLDLYFTTRGSVGDPWSTPQPISELNTAAGESDPFLTADGLTIYFQSDASGNDELFVATRGSTTATFGTPSPLTDLNTTANEQDIWLSPDGHHVIFSSNRNGDKDLFEAFR